MGTKKRFSTELAYLLGIVALALGTTFMERADLGMSMVVAPAYLLYLKLSTLLPAFTFGMTEYLFQALLLIVISVVLRKFKKSFLFSFVTAVLYGLALDLFMLAATALPDGALAWRLLWYVVGMGFCSLGVSFLFHTYIPPEAYELFVKELSAKRHWKIERVKTVYDCCSCLVAVALSFLFFGFGHFEGVKWGTIVCALVNGWLIGRISRLFEKKFDFRDTLKLRAKMNS